MSWHVLGFQRLRDNQITLRSDSKIQRRISLRFWELALLPLPHPNINHNFKLRTKGWVRGGMGVQFSSRFKAGHETGLVFRRIAPWVYTDDAITSKKLRWRLDPNSSAQNVPIVQFDTTPTQWNSSNLRSASTTGIPNRRVPWEGIRTVFFSQISQKMHLGVLETAFQGMEAAKVKKMENRMPSTPVYLFNHTLGEKEPLGT